MNTLSKIPCKWETVCERETQRGRIRVVLIGIPGSVFWHHRKHEPEFRERMRAANATLTKEGGAWAVIVWINRHNQTEVEGLGFVVPSVELKREDPF